MKLIILIGFLFIGLVGNAQTTAQVTQNTLTNSDIKEIKKAKDTVKKQCIKIDTIVSQLKEFTAIQEEFILKLRQRKIKQ